MKSGEKLIRLRNYRVVTEVLPGLLKKLPAYRIVSK